MNSFQEPITTMVTRGTRPLMDAARRIDFAGVSEDETIRIFLRIKPINLGRITDEINTKHYQHSGNSFISIISSGKGKIHNEYFFNGVLPPTRTQTEVFDIVVRPRLYEVLHGSDTLLFSYGTTGSGKSYTIQGKGSEPGIIPRVLYVIFASILNFEDNYGDMCPSKASDVNLITKQEMNKLNKEKNKLLDAANDILLQLASKPSADVNDTIRATSCSEMEATLQGLETVEVDEDDCLYSIWLSFIEIYNENIYDLFVDPESKVALKIAVDGDKNAYVKGVKYFCVSSWEEAYSLYVFGKHNLHVSPTTMNKSSSRSHCILNIKIIRRPKTNDGTFYCSSSFSICDLAGAERQKTTRNVGARLKESQNINTSLLVLNRCFNIIRTNQSKKNQEPQMVPFRESKLTLLFQYALLGNAGITMIANISQSDELCSETHQVLKSTAVTMKIEAKPFIKKTFARRKSIFLNFCSTKTGHSVGTSNEDEDNASYKSCNECNKYKEKLDEVQKTFETTLSEKQEESIQKEKDLRKELVDGFTKILGENYERNNERFEIMKKRHKEEMNSNISHYKAYYEHKLQKLTDEESSEKQQHLQELENQLKEQHLKNQQLEEELAQEKKQTEEIGQIQAKLFMLQKKVCTLVDIFGVQLPGKVYTEENGIEILDHTIQAHVNTNAKLLELEKILTKGVEDYKEIEGDFKKCELKVIQLEEEIVLKDHKIEELSNDINNLNALLEAKAREQEQEDIEKNIIAFRNLTLGTKERSDTTHSAVKPKLRRVHPKTVIEKCSDDSGTESDDPSFFLPKHANTTGKKKTKKQMNVRRRSKNLEIPSFSFVKQDEPSCSISSGSGIKARRKLYRNQSLSDNETIEVNNREISQVSPQSFMRNLRPKKH